LPLFTEYDVEAIFYLAILIGNEDGRDSCQRRSFLFHAADKLLDRYGITLHFDRDTRRRIPHLSGQLVAIGESINMGSKTDSLHDARYLNTFANRHT